MRITVKLHGGLGNQLFQLAFLDYVSELNNGLPYIENTNNVSPHSSNNYFETIFSNWKNLEENIIPEKIVNEINLQPQDWTIGEISAARFDGYFQNYKYVLDSFIPKLTFSDEILVKYPDIESKIFIHIRGGDYLSKNHSDIHNFPLDEYYEAAIDMFDSDTEFIIFTNDNDYAITKRFLQNIKYSFADENETDTLFLMSKCKGGICANSSFSWWGAYLNRKRKLILPSKWFNNVNFYTLGYYFDGSVTIDVEKQMWRFVDSVVYINLDKRTDRNDKMRHLTRIFGDKVWRFGAIDESPGCIGCTKSHIAVIELAVKNKFKNILVLEDDVQWYKFTDGYESLKDLSSRDYDVIHLGPSDATFDYNTNRLLSGNCTSSYLVNGPYLQTLLDNLKTGLNHLVSNPQIPIFTDKYACDQYWKILQKTDLWYTTIPSLMYQVEDFSDIANANAGGTISWAIDVPDWNFVDKIIYINLEKRGDRNDHMKQLFRREIRSSKVYRFTAIEDTIGCIGCTKSHIAVLEMAIENNWKNIIILEDDVDINNLQKGYSRLKTLIQMDFDVIMIGGTSLSYDPTDFRLSRGKTTSAYLVHQRYYGTLIDNYRKGLQLLEQHNGEPNYRLDVWWNSLQSKDKWYIVSPCLMYQISSYSDIENADVNYDEQFEINTSLNTRSVTSLVKPPILSFMKRKFRT